MVTRYLRFPGGKRKALTFSYDDGTRHDIRLVEIFKKHNMRATFNICSGWFLPEENYDPSKHKHNTLTQAEALEVYTPDVCEVACHGVDHNFLTACDITAACIDVIDDRRNLEGLFNRQIHGFAYANGAYNDEVINMLKSAGIYYARTTVSTLRFDMPRDWLQLQTTCHHKNPKLMDLADDFLELQPKYEPKIFYVWGHSYEFAGNDNWYIIEDFADKMANKDDIWYATNIELYYAWLDYTRLESSADGSIVHNPSVRSVWIGDKHGNSFEIKPGETIHFA